MLYLLVVQQVVPTIAATRKILLVSRLLFDDRVPTGAKWQGTTTTPGKDALD